MLSLTNTKGKVGLHIVDNAMVRVCHENNEELLMSSHKMKHTHQSELYYVLWTVYETFNPEHVHLALFVASSYISVAWLQLFSTGRRNNTLKGVKIYLQKA